MSSPSHVETIFFAALEKRSEAERMDYLQDACGHDDELRAQVTRLLSAYPRVGSFLEEPVVERVEADDGDDSTGDDAEPRQVAEGPGTLIGPYKLLEQIGEGGFGIVFMAEQQQPLRRKVAVKVLKPGMDSRAVIARFEAERQALALMDHENIAHVYDGGTTASGRPYFVMELVRGVPITQHCDENQLTARQRMELFVSVCRAVQHAHTKGVIHRDLKPSNVLVTMHDAVPVVKVIDFGIAKALGQQLTEKTLFTGFAQMIGTPLYMSPEQAEMSGLDVDTRADIYSLGVLLYELLTGTTPFDERRLREAGYDEMRRIIREEEPPKPSARIHTLGAAATTVSARRKCDPRRLCQLVHGELDWIVMKALEKDRKRRYETASALAADVENYLLGAVVAACPPSLVYRTRKFARRNRAALATAAGVLLALGVFTGGVGWVLRDQAARDAALDQEVNTAMFEARTLMVDSKLTEAASAIERTAKLLGAAGRPQLPAELAQLKHDLAMAERLEAIYGSPEGDEFFSGREVDAKYAQAFRDYGVDVAVLTADDAAERIRRSVIRLELARALDFWSSMRRRCQNEATPDWKQLLRLAGAVDADPWRGKLREALMLDDRQALESLATSDDVTNLPPMTLQLLGRALGDHGAVDGGVKLLRQAQRRHPDDLWINDTLGWFYLGVVKPPNCGEAVRFYTAARAVRPGYPYLLDGIGRALQLEGEFSESVEEFTEALQLKPDYVVALQHRGRSYLHLGEPVKALADFDRAIRLSPASAPCWCERAWANSKLGRGGLALVDATKATELDPGFAPAWTTRALAHQVLHEWSAAIDDCLHAIEVNPDFAPAWNEQAWILVSAADPNFRQPDRAIELVTRAIEIDPTDADFWNTLGTAHYRLGAWQVAAEVLEKAAQLRAAAEGIDSILLAMVEWQRGERTKARTYYDQAVDWVRTHEPPSEELWRFCAEAAALLEVEPPPKREPRFIDHEMFRNAIRRGAHLMTRPAKTNDPPAQGGEEKP